MLTDGHGIHFCMRLHWLRIRVAFANCSKSYSDLMGSWVHFFHRANRSSCPGVRHRRFGSLAIEHLQARMRGEKQGALRCGTRRPNIPRHLDSCPAASRSHWSSGSRRKISRRARVKRRQTVGSSLTKMAREEKGRWHSPGSVTPHRLSFSEALRVEVMRRRASARRSRRGFSDRLIANLAVSTGRSGRNPGFIEDHQGCILDPSSHTWRRADMSDQTGDPLLPDGRTTPMRKLSSISSWVQLLRRRYFGS